MPLNNDEMAALVNGVAQSIFKDAERYRWLRGCSGEQMREVCQYSGTDFDAEVDARMASTEVLPASSPAR